MPKCLVLLFLSLLIVGCSSEAKKSRLQERAKGYFEAGEYEKAKIEYMNLLRANPSDGAVIRQLGLIWWEQGAPVRAIPFLVEAARLNPNDVSIRHTLATALMSGGAFPQARKEALAILALDPKHEGALLVLADTSRTPEEIDAARQAIDAFPDRDGAAVHVASIPFLAREGDIPAAESAVQKALTTDPKSPFAHAAAASLRLVQKDNEGAARELKLAAELSPVRSFQRIKYAEFKAQQGALDEARAWIDDITRQARDYVPAWLLLAQMDFNAKSHDQALATLEKVFSLDPENLPARLLQAQVWMAKGEPKKAVDGLEKLATAQPKMPGIKFHLARALLQDGDKAKALAHLNQLTEANPDFVEAILLLAEVNLQTGQPEFVVPAMRTLLRKQPNLVQASLLLVRAVQAQGRFGDAAAAMKDIIKVEPDKAEHYSRLGDLLRRANQRDEARTAFEKALELEPDNLATIGQLVDLDLLQSKVDSAIQRIQPILDKNPDSAFAHFFMGKVYVSKDSWDQAETELLKAIELQEDFPDAYELLVRVYVTTKKLPQAVAKLEQRLAAKPGDLSALKLVGLIRGQQGEFAEAAQAYEKLLAAAPAPEPMVQNNLAYLYAEHLNQPDKALELARTARTHRPSVESAIDPTAKLEAASIADTLGWILYRRGEFPEALALAREAAGYLGQNPEVQYHIGMAAYSMGQSDAARAAFTLADASTADFPGRSEVKSRLALLGATDATATALPIGELEALLKKQPGDIVLQARLAQAFEQAGDFTKAAATYSAILKLNPTHPAAALKLAQLHEGPLQKPDQALEFAKKARELAPDDPQAAGVLGRLRYRAGDFSVAYDLLRESARGLPADATVHHALAWTSYSLGKVPEARSAMERLLAAAPASPQAADAKSFLAMTAVADATQALAATPEADALLKRDAGYVPALMVRAAAQRGTDEAKAAVVTCESILTRWPDFAPAQKLLASMYADDPGSRAKAYELAVKARKSLPDDPDLPRILAILSYHRKEFAYTVQLLQESARAKPLDATGLFYLGMSQFQTGEKAASKLTLVSAVDAGLPEGLATEAKRVLDELAK